MRIFSGLITALLLSLATSAQGQFRRVDTVPVISTNSNDIARITAASGTFDLKTSKGSNSCRITLWSEGAKGTFPVSIPAGCHKAFPSLLAKVKNWMVGNDISLKLIEEKGFVLLEFQEKDGKLLSSKIGEITYELQPTDAGWFKRQASLPRQTDVAGASKPVDAAEIARMVGTYAVSREKGKPSECKIVFSVQAYIKPGFMKAGIGEGCQDRGMQIFNPVAWQLEASRLILVSRKGHDIKFIRAGSVGWKKEKQSGDMLELTR